MCMCVYIYSYLFFLNITIYISIHTYTHIYIVIFRKKRISRNLKKPSVMPEGNFSSGKVQSGLDETE